MLSPLDIFGLRPFRDRFRDFLRTFRGDPHTPASHFGLSSINIFKPHISIPTWMGQKRWDRRAPIYNFFNRIAPPLDQGYSVKVKQVRDFRGGRLTYDSHRGTDFAIPVGTPIVTAASGKVALISNDFDRGGLKLFIDHGQGLFTGYSHLARTMVEVGDLVQRGQTIALSGASGVELLLCFPLVAPHLHLNVYLNGQLVDPFAIAGSDEISLWRAGSHPTPYEGNCEDDYQPTQWSQDRIQHALSLCRSPELKQHLESLGSLDHQAAEIIFQTTFYPTRFTEQPQIYETPAVRTPRLDLPFHSRDFIGVSYPGYPSVNRKANPALYKG